MAAGRLHAYFDDLEHTVQRVLQRLDVLNARIENVSLVAEQDPGADDELVGQVDVTKGRPAVERVQRVGNHHPQRPHLPGGITAAGREQHQQRRNEQTTQIGPDDEQKRRGV